MANGVTTEWEDIHVKLGNYKPRPKETPESEYTKEAIQKIEQYDVLEKKDLDELNDLEQDYFQDDDFIKQYQAKRLQELKEFQEKPKYGFVEEINKQQYVEQVTNATKGTYVVLHLYQNYNEKCVLINQILEVLAKKYPLIKFLKIIADKCVEKFPDSNIPCFIIYKDGSLIENIMQVDKYIPKIHINNIELLLGKLNIIPSEELDGVEEEINKYQTLTKGHIFSQKVQKISKEDDEDDYDNDDRDDRGYMSNQFQKY